MRFYEFNPVAAWTFARIRRENFNDVAGVEHGVERHDFSVDLRADTLVSDRTVDCVGKVDGRAADRQIQHFSFRRENVNFVGENVAFDIFQNSWLSDDSRWVSITSRSQLIWSSILVAPVFLPYISSAPRCRIPRCGAFRTCGSGFQKFP